MPAAFPTYSINEKLVPRLPIAIELWGRVRRAIGLAGEEAEVRASVPYWDRLRHRQFARAGFSPTARAIRQELPHDRKASVVERVPKIFSQFRDRPIRDDHVDVERG
jgi:hypothetical protein